MFLNIQKSLSAIHVTQKKALGYRAKLNAVKNAIKIFPLSFKNKDVILLILKIVNDNLQFLISYLLNILRA